MPDTVVSVFDAHVTAHPHAIALSSGDGTVRWTRRELAQKAARLASAFSALGVRPGDSVALLIGNRPEWQLSDLAALLVGATPFSLYITAPPAESAELVTRARARLIVADPELLQDDHVPTGVPVVTVDELDRLQTDASFVAHAPEPDDVATLIFTSGTTGKPKGVELTHAAIVFQLRALDSIVRLDGGATVSYLPHAHIVDRVVGHYAGLIGGTSVTTVADPTTLFDVLQRVQPRLFTSVPRIWQRIERLMRGMLRDGATHEQVASRFGLDGAHWLITGSAPLPASTHEFFASVGLPLHDLWGLSETTAVATYTGPDDAFRTRVGTVGRPLPGTAVRLAGDGEILVRGPHLARGYLDDPRATAASFVDGWFHTGDLGEWRGEFLTVTGRKKDLIITAGGENISPSRIEDVVAQSPLVDQVLVIGDGRPFLVALVVPDFAELALRGLHGDPEELVADPRTRTLLETALDTANEKLGKAEKVRAHAVLARPWTSDSGELTPTHKLRRGTVEESNRAVIEELYAGTRPRDRHADSTPAG
ncbi:AMP-dependent synthetase/ligase [Pseudonocardia kujensis]|uniref:AMP-dependent synthetase/ligase n=1 Tax=Pseudonocardia kujensis TaxID=1128675 RepID=UPI001E4DA994|nr:AMP-dependent synthetase/ligase [Pseudonocardia kujensis]MCE0765104.1 AMP-dependent synthetase/ligase [Pseudonocardia kujensis]